jgi:Ni/Fe-hydrogenase subunit HybB-like protein
MDSAVGRAITPSGWMTEKLLLGLPPREYMRGLLTPFNVIAAAILLAGVPAIAYRFAYGLGAATNLTQATPWGLWIGLDMLGGVALAAGGYTVAAAVYLFGLREYRPVLRAAVLTGFLGYILAVLGLMCDLGQPWRLPFPLFFSHGTTSVMFEVAWCISLYSLVLALEFAPAVFEWLGWRNIRAWLNRIMIGAVIFGVLLSTLHQSSLGALFLTAPHKIHPLWYSPFIPIFFFVSSIVAGLAMVIAESSLSHRLFRDRLDPRRHVDLDGITLGLGKAASVVLFVYFFLKVQGVAEGGHWALLATPYGHWFLVEMLGFVLLPCLLFAHGVRSANARLVRGTAVVAVLGVVLNRLNVSIVAYNWNAAERYVPSALEILTSLTIITIGILVFRWIVNRMPVLDEHPDYRGSH